MQYMLLIYSADDAGPQPGSPEFGKMMQGYMDFNAEVNAAGVFVSGQPLQGSDTATTVKVRGNKTQNTDGPFAETKEVLGGYYVLDCENLDEVLGWAAKIPTADYGSIEVRPIMALPS